MVKQTKPIAESKNFIVLDKYTKEWETAEQYQSEDDLDLIDQAALLDRQRHPALNPNKRYRQSQGSDQCGEGLRLSTPFAFGLYIILALQPRAGRWEVTLIENLQTPYCRGARLRQVGAAATGSVILILGLGQKNKRQTWHAPAGAPRPAHRMGLYLRRDLSKGKGAGLDHRRLGATGIEKSGTEISSSISFDMLRISPWGLAQRQPVNHAQRQAHRDRQIRVSRLAAA